MDHQYITSQCGCISVTQVYSLMTDIQQDLSPASKTKPGQTTILPVKVVTVILYVVWIFSPFSHCTSFSFHSETYVTYIRISTYIALLL